MLKKIIIYYPSFERGGVEKTLTNLINYFLKKKKKVLLISSSFNDKHILSHNLFELKKINEKKYFFLNRIFRALVAGFFLIEQFRYASSKDSIIFSLQSSVISIILSRLHGFKIVVRNAEDPIYSIIYDKNKFLSSITFLLKIIFYNFSNGIITNSNGSKKSLRKILPFYKNLDYIYNPYLKKKKKIIHLKKKNLIFSVGRLTEQKNFQGLIKSFFLFNKKNNKYKLIIAGDGPLRQKLEILTKNLKIEKKVIFIGWKENLEHYYKNSKIFILNSVYEGLGNVLIDAVNYEIPIITTDCNSGPQEIVDYGKGGFVVPINSNYKLYKKILYVLNNYNLAKKKSIIAKKRIFRFMYQDNSNKYLSFLENIFNSK
jgi:glycosyltransferase involved in cell wall biosynthesis